MKRAEKFIIPSNWLVLFKDLGIDIQAALTYANLPIGLFEQKKVQLTITQYFELWLGVDKVARDREIDLPLRFAEVMSFESFDTPIFAAICSPNLNSATKRLQEYKPLIGPMEITLAQNENHTEIGLECYGYAGVLPKSLNLVELAFYTQLVRLATRKHINPVKVQVTERPTNIEDYTAYFGCEITVGDSAIIVFSHEDAVTPFLTNNQTMLTLFESELQKKLEQMTSEHSVTAQTYNHFLDLLPQGKSSIDEVASRMAMSKRTLQRKLSTEGNNFQSVLNKVREELAHYYLNETELPLAEVSFLLGFQESNSFARAYSSWTGNSPSHARV